MQAKLLSLGTAGMLVALAGCANQTMPTQVTRFHLAQPIARGQVSVEPRFAQARGSLEFQTYANIVGAELASAGFTESPGLATSELVATVDVRRGVRDGGPRRSPVSIGLGGGVGSGGYRSGGGVGAGISFPLGKAKSRDLVATGLEVQIKRRSDSTVIWEGRAETQAYGDDPAAAPEASVRKLAAAMFKGFPGESGRTITVR